MQESHSIIPLHNPTYEPSLTFRAFDHAFLLTIAFRNYPNLAMHSLSKCRQLATMARAEQRWHLHGKEYRNQMEQDGQRRLANAIAWTCGRDAMHLEQRDLSYQFGE